jgi:hypothetical protein
MTAVPRYPTQGYQTCTVTVTTASGHYSRQQPVILMCWTCAVCGKAHERWQLPGNPPRYCPPPSECQKEANRQRVRKHRMERA